jgi:protein-L-isoaspartate(D-aspartate) O-methyltransferase
MTGYQTARACMVESQLRPNKVTDKLLLDAFLATQRELFVPEHLEGVAYVDEDLPLGKGRHMMEPRVAARLLQAAAIERTDTALIVGAGTGYEAAVVAILARSVVALEEDPELARRARAALVEHSIASVSVVEAPLPQGHRARAPYDVIFFCGAVAEVPTEIASQLADGGRLMAVVKSGSGIGHATLTTGIGGGLARRVLFDAATPLLPGFLPKPVFVF